MPQATCAPSILTLCAGARVDPAFELPMTLPPPDQQSIRDAIAREESRLLRIEKELGEAQARLAAFKTALTRADSLERLPPLENPPSEPSTPAEKVALFRSRFRGRVDVYPRFWTNAWSILLPAFRASLAISLSSVGA